MPLPTSLRYRSAQLARLVLLAARAVLVALRSGLQWAAGVDIHDACLLGGIGLLFFGLWQIWKPLPYVVIGALLIRLAVGPLVPAAPPSPQEKRTRHGAR